jgi:hypothetical protein
LRSQFDRRILIGLLLTTLVAGCGVFNRAEPTPIPTDTPVPTPSLTPTPEVPLVILVLPNTLDKEHSDLYQKTAYELAQQEGYRFQVRNALTPADLEPALKVVIALPPDPGLAQLAAAAPQAQFLAVNIPDITPGGNLSVLGGNIQPDIPAFLAGYIGAMITRDYHLGLVTVKDDPQAQLIDTAYSNGMTFYCGLCNPWAGPFYDFPIDQPVPTDAQPSEYNPYLGVLINYNVQTVYIPPALANEDMLLTASNNGLQFITTTAPTRALPGLVAAIQPDVVSAIQSAWPDLVAGHGGETIQSPPTLTNVDSELLSPGKQRLAEEVLKGLLDGSISTGTQ